MSTAEEKIDRLVEFALQFKNDPDFNRLVFPPAVLAKLAEKGVEVKPKTYSVSQAVDRCMSMKSDERYTTNTIELIDQTSLECSFPQIPPLASPTDTNETKNPESEDSSSPPVSDAESNTAVVVPSPSSVENPTPQPDQTESS